MVDQINFPTPQAYSGGADFSQLANLGNVYQAAQEKARQQAALASLGSDPRANVQALIGSGSLPLATAGLDLQSQQQARAEQIRQFEAQQAIRNAQEQRAATADEQNTPQWRAKTAAAYGLDMKDVGIRNWIIGGGDLAKARTSLGTPIWTRDQATGELRPYQQSTTGDPVPMNFPQGQIPLGPGEIAAQKQEGTSMAKAKATAAVALPKVADQVTTNIQALDDLAAHPGRESATGKYRGLLADDSLLLSQPAVDFRNQFNHVKSQAYLSAFDTLRGAGSISNSEGIAGKEAVNRLSTVTSPEEFNRALKEARQYYTLGLDRAQRAAKGDFSTHPPELRPADYGAPSSNKRGEPLIDIFPRKK